MLALLALVLFPVAAQAEECSTSSCATYNPVVPSAGAGPSKENPLNEGGHDDSGTQGTAHGSAADPDESGGSNGEPGSNGSEAGGNGKDKHGGGVPSGDGGKNPPSSGGDAGSQSSDGSKVAVGENEGLEGNASGEPTASSNDDGSSSPVIPILIAVAVLAAISIGVVLYRQRKSGQDPDGRGSVSSSNAS